MSVKNLMKMIWVPQSDSSMANCVIGVRAFRCGQAMCSTLVGGVVIVFRLFASRPRHHSLSAAYTTRTQQMTLGVFVQIVFFPDLPQTRDFDTVRRPSPRPSAS